MEADARKLDGRCYGLFKMGGIAQGRLTPNSGRSDCGKLGVSARLDGKCFLGPVPF
jgi:hypothetical protein